MNSDLLAPGVGPISARKIRVVLVDDSELSQKFLSHVLETCPRVEIAGHANDGLDGFALVAGLRPDLVITDLEMPRCDGFQLARLLRDRYPGIRSIIVSAHDGPGFYPASLQHGADAFISKRRLLDEFPRMLNRLFPENAQPIDSICKPRVSKHTKPSESPSRPGKRNVR